MRQLLFLYLDFDNAYLIAMRILLVFLLFALQMGAQEKSFKIGVVTDSLMVSDTLNDSYALYLPTKFDGKAALPVIFVFDGEGRGKSAARLFQPPAEQQGYIIVSSNDIRKEVSLEDNLTSAVRLVQEMSKTIPMDLKNVSFAGFAEGAKVATSLPLIFNNSHGVIYVGDQLFNFGMAEDVKPFTAVGIVGNQQVNLGLMEMSAIQLRAMGYPGILYVFEGGLEWPDPGLVTSAMGDLTLEAIKSKKRSYDTALVSQLYEQDIARAEKLISTGDFLMAHNFLEGLTEKYKGILPTGGVKDRLKELLKSKDFREQRELFQEVQEKEERLWNDFLYYYDEDIATANFENLGWWNFQKLELQKLTEGENKAEAAMAYRLLDLLERLTREKLVEVEKEDVSLESKLLAYMLATVFDQKNFEAYKKVISLSTMDNDYSTALFFLEEMLKNGFKDLDALYEIEGTLGIKLNREYNWIIKKYLGSSRYFENATSLY